MIRFSEKGGKQKEIPVHHKLEQILDNYLDATGVAQRIAGHAHSRTTKLYDRRGQKVLLEDIERVRY